MFKSSQIVLRRCTLLDTEKAQDCTDTARVLFIFRRVSTQPAISILIRATRHMFVQKNVINGFDYTISVWLCLRCSFLLCSTRATTETTAKLTHACPVIQLCYILLDIILLVLITWHAFASSYKHKRRFLQTRKTIVSPLGWCLSEQLCWVVIGKLDFLEHTWSEHSWTSASTLLQDETRR